MKLFELKQTVSVLGISLAVLIGVTAASAQNRGQVNQRNQQIRQEQIRQENLKRQQELQRLERERQQAAARQAQANRYRVNRGGQWHNVDNRQADLLKQAINAGYRQGFTAGRNDRNSRRGMNWSNSNVYRSGTYGYQSYVNRNLYQHYFQQGFQRGYQDGYNSRNQFGNGSSILGTILQGILGLQSY